MNFTIDPAHLCSITIREEWSMFRNKEKLTDEELIKVLKGEDRCSSTKTDDHPEFKALREKLGQEGYIKIQRGWWNGDTVIKPFTLNGSKFIVSDQFPCAAAMPGHIRYHKT